MLITSNTEGKEEKKPKKEKKREFFIDFLMKFLKVHIFSIFVHMNCMSIVCFYSICTYGVHIFSIFVHMNCMFSTSQLYINCMSIKP